MAVDIDFDKIQAEKREIDVLLDRGVKFEIPRPFPFNLGKRKTWFFTIYEPYLNTLDHISSLSIDLVYDEDKIQENPFLESKQLVKKHIFRTAKIMAIAYLNNATKIKLFANLLAFFFLCNIKPSKLFAYATAMNAMCNFGDFTNSIRLMSGARTTQPVLESLIETKESQKD